MRERNGDKVSSPEMLNHGFVHDCRTSARLSCKERVWGRYRERTMKQNEKSGVTACTKVGQVHSQTSLTASHDITSFVGQRRDAMRWPPALNKKLFGTECDTHRLERLAGA